MISIYNFGEISCENSEVVDMTGTIVHQYEPIHDYSHYYCTKYLWDEKKRDKN